MEEHMLINNMNSTMNLMESISSMGLEIFAMKYVCNILDKIVKNNSLKIVCMCLLLCITKYPDRLFSLLKIIGIKLFYKKLEVNANKDTYEGYLFKQIQTNLNPKKEKSITSEFNKLPLYLTTLNDKSSYIEYCPIIQQKVINTYIADSQKLYNQEIKIINKSKLTKTVLKDAMRKVFTPDTLYPSSNYEKLDNIIEKFFTVVKLTHMYKAQGILIDGEPGLGKSRSCDYLASLNKYDEINYINMSLTALLRKDFNNIVKEIVQSKKEGTTIIYFDELDKYLDYNIMYTYKQKLILKEKDSSIISQKDNSEIDNLEINTTIIFDFDDFKNEYKQNFLYSLLEMIEINTYDDGIVFIFCSNNFDTIFEGVNPIHFNSLRNRFASIKFERCNYEEVIGYINYFNNLMLGTLMYYDPIELNNLINQLIPNISITYRTIRHLHINAGYDIKKLIDLINNNINFDNKELILSTTFYKKNNYYYIDEDIDENINNNIDRNDIDDVNDVNDVNNVNDIDDIDIDVDDIENIPNYYLTDIINILKKAILQNNNEGNKIVASIVCSGFNLETICNNGLTPLMHAVDIENEICTKLLIKYGANVNAINQTNNYSVLHYAFKNFLSDHRCKIINLLFKYGAKWDNSIITIIKNSLQNTTTIKYLIQNGIAINTTFGIKKNSFLHHQYNTEIITYLINNGIDINIKSSHDLTPLMLAVNQNKYDVVKMLLKHGADKNVKDKSNNNVYAFVQTPNMKLLLDQY